MFRRTITIVFAILASFHWVSPGTAQASYPERTITLVVTFPAGGRSDLTGRSIAEALALQIGTSVVVVNKVGAGGVLGAKYVAQAKSDGYTIGLFSSSVVAAQYTVETGTDLDDYKVAGLVEISPAAIGVEADAPWKSLSELITSAKEHPMVLNISTTPGGGSQVFAGAFLNTAGVEMTEVPFNGDTPSVIALAGGHIDVHVGVPASFKSLAKAGKVRILSVASDQRMPQLPDVATFKEQGVDLTIGAFHALYLPNDTPEDIVNIVEAALRTAMTEESVTKKMESVGLGPTFLDRDAAKKFLVQQDDTYRRLIIELGLLHASKK